MTNQASNSHQRSFKIDWGDMDALGHVNNAKFFDYFQQSRIEWLETLDLDLLQTEGPVIAEISCRYYRPVVYPATLCIHSQVSDFGRSSLVMTHQVFQGETLMAEGSSKIVWVDYQKQKSVPLPEKIRLTQPPAP